MCEANKPWLASPNSFPISPSGRSLYYSPEVAIFVGKYGALVDLHILARIAVLHGCPIVEQQVDRHRL